MMDLPFHIPDDVWKYLKEYESVFLSEEDKQNPRLERLLHEFREGRHAYY
jgi:hypothetical protein